MVAAIYVAQDALIRHQGEERSLACEGSICQCKGMPGQGNGWECVVGGNTLMGERRWEVGNGDCRVETGKGNNI